MRPYHFSIDVRLPFKKAIVKLQSALNAEHLSVVGEIEVQAILKKKLGLDLPAQKIFGVCSPKLAHSMLSTDPDIGAMLPCSVFIREIDPDNTRIVLQDPAIIASCSQHTEVHTACDLARSSLRRVMDRLALGQRNA